jgi:hypothetical protein
MNGKIWKKNWKIFKRDRIKNNKKKLGNSNKPSKKEIKQKRHDDNI